MQLKNSQYIKNITIKMKHQKILHHLLLMISHQKKYIIKKMKKMKKIKKMKKMKKIKKMKILKKIK